MSEQQSLLPAAPWYSSSVQVAAVVAGLSQLASILIRWVGLPVTDVQLDIYTADALQFVTIGAGLLAVLKRGNSAVAPLTLTAGGAAKQNAANPPMLDADPTKTPAPQQVATMSTKEPT